jgi:predicted ATPase/class 3 adenylate cyclase
MSCLPTGTLTFLHTDIEGSTRLWEEQPDAMRHALALHDSIAFDRIERHNGIIVKQRGEGDSVFAVFESATDALAAVVELQRALAVQGWPPRAPIRVRAALHTGQAELREDDYAGSAPNRCARLRGIAHGGQVVISQAIRELVGDALPEGVSLRDMGKHRLKDLLQPEHVFQVEHPDLPSEFPPLKSLDVRKHNLPIQLTSYIGREAEMAEVRDLLAEHRLVTLTGAGGIGKTRLALQAAAEVVDEYEDGVWLVDLAPLTDEALVPQVLAKALGVREQPRRPLDETLVDYLGDRRSLIIMDNCEHVVEGCTRLVEKLLTICPRVEVVATSREALDIGGEVIHVVPPLALPNGQGGRPESPELVQAVSRFEATRLFVERARASRGSLAVTPPVAAAVVEVCRRLDGIPLAIELAAARVKVLSVEQIAQRLEDALTLLTDGARTALPRQQTLRGAMQWSYGLLEEQERVLFRRLAVFRGGWTLEAAEAVCSGDGLPRGDILQVLGRLVDKSLVVVDEQRGEVRYRLLEPVRNFAAEQLRTREQYAEARQGHAAFFLALAESAAPQLRGAGQTVWLPRLEADYPNLRAAMRWFSRQSDVGSGLRLATALVDFWNVRGHVTEARDTLAALLEHSDEDAVTVSVRAPALAAAGYFAFRQADYSAARPALEEAIQLSVSLRDKQGVAKSLNQLGNVLYAEGDIAAAAEYFEESTAAFREADDAVGAASALHNLGDCALVQGEYVQAEHRLQEGLELCQAAGDRVGIAMGLRCLAVARLNQGDLDVALRMLRESAAINLELGHRWAMANTLAGFAELAASATRHEEAMRLAGAAWAAWDALQTPLPPPDVAALEAALDVGRRALGTHAAPRAEREGRAMEPEEPLRYALEVLGDAQERLAPGT